MLGFCAPHDTPATRGFLRTRSFWLLADVAVGALFCVCCVRFTSAVGRVPVPVCIRLKLLTHGTDDLYDLFPLDLDLPFLYLGQIDSWFV